MPSFFPMPLFGDITLLLTAIGSGILCMILGYLLGYFTTHRSQSEYLGAQQQLANLQGQNYRQQATSIGIPLGEASSAALPPRKTKTDSTEPTVPEANDARLVELKRLSDGLAARNEQLVKELREERRTRSELELAASRLPVADGVTDTDWQLGKLNQEVIGLQQRLDLRQDEIDGLTSQRDEAETARRAANQSLDELRGLLGQGEAVVASLEREKSDLRNQVNDLQTRLALAEDRGDSQSTEEERNSLQRTIESLKQNLDQRDLAILSMERELSNLRIARDRVASLEISIAERNNFAERLSQQLVAAGGERKAVAARFDELNREVKSRDETLESMKGDLDAARRRADELEEVQRNSASERTRLEELVAELQSHEEKHLVERQTLLIDSNELGSVRSQYEQLQESHRQLLAEHDDAQSVISDLTSRVGNMVGEIQQLTLTANEAQTLKGQRDELEQKVCGYEHSQSQLRQNLEEITGRAEELTVAMRDFAHDREELDSIRLRNQDLLEQLGRKEAEAIEQVNKSERLAEQLQEHQEKRNELEAAAAEGDRFRRQVATLEDEGRQSQASLTESQELIAQLRAELAGQTRDYELARTHADQHVADLQARIGELSAVGSELSSVRGEMESTCQQQRDAYRQLQDAESSTADELRKNQLLKAQIHDLEVQLFQLKAEFSEVSQLRQRVAELDRNANQSATSLAESQELISRLTTELHEYAELSQREADLRQQLEGTRLRIDQLDVECRGLQARAELAEHDSVENRTEIDKLTETIRMLEVAHSEKLGELDAIRVQIADQEQASRQAESEFTDREQRLMEQISKIEVENRTLQDQLHVMVDQLAEASASLARMQETSDSAEHPERIAMSVDESQALNDRLVEFASQTEARTAELELKTAELAEARTANSELSDKLAEADEEQVLLATELRSIRAEAEKLRAELERESQEKSASDVDTIQELSDKYKAAVERATRAERELTDSRNELYRQSEAANTWRQERAELLDQLEQIEQNYNQLAEKVAHPSTPKSEANLDSDVESPAKHNQDLESELQQAQTQADKQKSQLREVAAALSAARREIASLRSELSEAQAVLLTSRTPGLPGSTTSDGTLPTQRSRSAKPKAQEPNDDAGVHKKSSKSNRYGGSQVAKHPLLGKVYSQTPKVTDDLREIKGLGSAFEKRLHELGIFQFSQIVKWKSSVTTEIAKLLGTNDKTVSVWIEEAGKLNRGRST